eukprot:COSAG03_NODE_12279_length_554_cov_0.863736_1_plen_92_part_01
MRGLESDGVPAPRSRESAATNKSLRGVLRRGGGTPQNCTAIDSAYPRRAEFRCLLNRRGVHAAPVLNGEGEPPRMAREAAWCSSWTGARERA